jgi:hypothetical protein
MVEEDFQQSKGQAGLDHTQVRRYRSWLRHAIAALAALAALAIQAVTAAKQRKHHPDPVLPTHADDDPPDDYGLIALTVPEIHRLLGLHDELRDLPTPTAQQRQLGERKVRFEPADRALLAALLHRLPTDVLRRLRLLVHPDTVLRWHRDLIARRHAARSRPRRTGRPRTLRSIRALVLRLAREN